MADVSDIIAAYDNLLIIQYHDQPKAKATIDLFMTALMASGVALDVLNGYDIYTAVGVQLDVIGKYVGVNRFYYQVGSLTDFFSYVTYTEVQAGGYDLIAKWGFEQYSTFGEYDENGTLIYNELIGGFGGSNYALSDADFRTLIFLKILLNNTNSSEKSINDGIFDIFGMSVTADFPGGMLMYYFGDGLQNSILKAAFTKKIMPKPLGVALYLIEQTEPFFGLAKYGAGVPVYSPLIEGFTTYATWATVGGDTLIYSDIIAE
jgi:hypothetical protein